jgi:ABC-type transport system involved in multi-copper enzyme maturation permease subunit
MTFLPIVVRELRVASRKRRTFWLRVAAALVALLIGSAVLLMSLQGAIPATSLGAALFGIITWLAFATVICAGIFFTADCLSEEKREGTLGFLFLTDLRGYDIVGGKLLATSLRSLFALLAVFPVLALTLTLGGVTGAGFWKASLALTNALVCSLTAGLFVSSISRDSQKAMGGTLLLLIFWAATGLVLDAIPRINPRGSEPFYSLTSPLYLFQAADAWGRPPFWKALLANQIVAWLLFALASLIVPHAWKEKKSRPGAAVSSWSYAWRYGRQGRRLALRQKILGQNPVMWLACRERWQAVGVWGIAAVVIVPLAALSIYGQVDALFYLRGVLGWLCVWVLYLWAASQASRFFVEGRRTGLLELLLATPVPVTDVTSGHWRAFRRMFALPVLLMLGTLAIATLAPTFLGVAGPGVGEDHWLTALSTAVIGFVAPVANIVALIWVGMWMGLTSKNSGLATAKTLVIVQVVPAMVIAFASGILAYALIIPSLMKAAASKGGTAPFGPAMSVWFPLLLTGLSVTLTLAKDVFFSLWARKRLHRRFRDEASRSLGAPRTQAVPPLIPAAIPAPPPRM